MEESSVVLFKILGGCLGFVMAAAAAAAAVVVMGLLIRLWVLPYLAYKRLQANGFSGPNPNLPFGNLNQMKKRSTNFNTYTPPPTSSHHKTSTISNDIHPLVFPHFSTWQKSYGKVFVYWIGAEPFLYVADPEFVKQMTSDILGKDWGKANVFKAQRHPLFGKSGLVDIEGDTWLRHRHVITPAFSPANLKTLASLMVESATAMVHRWSAMITSGHPEIDVEAEFSRTIGEIVSKTSLGITYDVGSEIVNKLRSLQVTLYNSSRFVGVPFGNFVKPNQKRKAVKLGKEIDAILYSIVDDRMEIGGGGHPENDLLGWMLSPENVKTGLRREEIVDECKTFFFGGYETTRLVLGWTLALLAAHPDWQVQLRDEIQQVIGDAQFLDANKLSALKKMGWVWNEVLRLYSPGPNIQRQAKHDIHVGDRDLVIPKGTNIWIDIVSMHHDSDLWGEKVNEFKPERFKDNVHGGCNHKMGYLPFGFGGRMCIGRNLSNLEYRVVLTLILSNFSFSLSPNYRHSPYIMLSMRPMHGLPMVFQPL